VAGLAELCQTGHYKIGRISKQITRVLELCWGQGANPHY
jgi:hypothetical protein